MRLLVMFITALVSVAAMAAPKTEKTANPTLADIETTLGSVPGFFKLFPPEGLPGAWDEFKNIQGSPNSQISPKYKELIGVAISAQIPCRYCVYFHTKFAKLNGASDREINESIAIAGMTRKWSSYFYGHQFDMSAMRKDVDKMVSHAKSMMEKKQAPPAPLEVTDATTALKDIENQLGFVPEMFKAYPRAGLAGAWKEMRDLEMNPNTAVPGKFKSLVSLAVASQVPCQYCVYADTEFAKLDGATSEEIGEAIAMAGLVRHWSTFLNGIQPDETKFHQEIDKLVNAMKKRVAQRAQE